MGRRLAAVMDSCIRVYLERERLRGAKPIATPTVLPSQKETAIAQPLTEGITRRSLLGLGYSKVKNAVRSLVGSAKPAESAIEPIKLERLSGEPSPGRARISSIIGLGSTNSYPYSVMLRHALRVGTIQPALLAAAEVATIEKPGNESDRNEAARAIVLFAIVERDSYYTMLPKLDNCSDMLVPALREIAIARDTEETVRSAALREYFQLENLGTLSQMLHNAENEALAKQSIALFGASFSVGYLDVFTQNISSEPYSVAKAAISAALTVAYVAHVRRKLRDTRALVAIRLDEMDAGTSTGLIEQ